MKMMGSLRNFDVIMGVVRRCGDCSWWQCIGLLYTISV